MVGDDKIYQYNKRINNKYLTGHNHTMLRKKNKEIVHLPKNNHYVIKENAKYNITAAYHLKKKFTN